jgi:hypothetical protein
MGSTSLPYYMVYCPVVMVASCYKTVKGLGHHDQNANHLHKNKERKLDKGKKIMVVPTLPLPVEG